MLSREVDTPEERGYLPRVLHVTVYLWALALLLSEIVTTRENGHRDFYAGALAPMATWMCWAAMGAIR